MFNLKGAELNQREIGWYICFKNPVNNLMAMYSCHGHCNRTTDRERLQRGGRPPPVQKSEDWAWSTDS